MVVEVEVVVVVVLLGCSLAALKIIYGISCVRAVVGLWHLSRTQLHVPILSVVELNSGFCL